MSRARAKGTAYESAVVGYLNDHGFPDAERRALNGARDRGDVAGLPGWVWELKNHREISLGTFVTETEKEAKNAGVARYATVIKRRQKGVSESFAVIPLWLLVELIGGEQ